MPNLRCIFLFISFIATLVLMSPAQASSPGMIEGPAGCDWEAKVVSAEASSGVTLQLTKMHGTCMMDYGNCGKEGDTVTAPLGDKDAAAYAAGSTVNVWVSSPEVGAGTAVLTATLQHPDPDNTLAGKHAGNSGNRLLPV